jgi:hypothetical protein
MKELTPGPGAYDIDGNAIKQVPAYLHTFATMRYPRCFSIVCAEQGCSPALRHRNAVEAYRCRKANHSKRPIHRQHKWFVVPLVTSAYTLGSFPQENGMESSLALSCFFNMMYDSPHSCVTAIAYRTGWASVVAWLPQIPQRKEHCEPRGCSSVLTRVAFPCDQLQRRASARNLPPAHCTCSHPSAAKN